MKFLRYTDRNFDQEIRKLNRISESSPEVQSTVSKILAEVRKEGDSALISYTEKFGGGKLQPSQLLVSKKEMTSAVALLSPKERRAVLAARSNVLQFAKRSLKKSWCAKNAQGALVGERFDPFERVGIYVPGGTAPLVSSAVMTCTLAMAAKVPQIVVTTPGDGEGRVHSGLLAALSLCGATEIYRVGGAQAVAALAYGTKTILPVRKVFGPGNAYVVEAKRQVFGAVSIDLLPGPSEILVIADAAAHPHWIAADLLAQAEHGQGSVAILLTDSEKQLQAVGQALDDQMTFRSRTIHLTAALRNTCFILCAHLQQCIQLANEFASEHVSLATQDPDTLAAQLTTSGAIFLGGISPVAGGDFLAGPSHVLPTGGAGKAFSGLNVDQFQHRTSILRFDEASLRKSLPLLKTLSAVEGLDAHAYSASIRLKTSP